MSRLSPHTQTVLLLAAGAVALPIATAHAMPELLPGSQCLALALGVSLGMAALSLNLLLGYAGQVSLGHAALLGVGAFTASLLVSKAELPMLLSFPAAAAVGAVTALVIGLPALRLRGLYLALVTIVFGTTLQASLFRWDFFGSGSSGAAMPQRLWGSHVLNDPSTYLSLTLLLLLGVWLLDRNVTDSRIGRAFRLIREDEDAAQALAIDVTRYKLFAFILSGAIAGLAGAAYGHSIGYVNSDTFPLELSLRLVVIVVIGGLGYRWGVVAVATLLSVSPWLPEFLEDYELAFGAVALLLTLALNPRGLAGKLADAIARPPGPAPTGAVAPAFVVPARDLPAQRTSATVLEVHSATVDYDGLRAVDDVSLEVRPGTIVGLIGPNGAGKTSLFNAISGFVPLSAGGVVLDGLNVTHLPPHRRAAAGLSRTFQNIGLAKDLSLRENLRLAQHAQATYGDVSALLRTRAVREREAALDEQAAAAMSALGLERYADTPVRRLSIGQQRLVEIAAVLLSRPKLLMLDEPAAGLSPAAAESLAERLLGLRDEHGQTLLLIEHNVPLVFATCDYVYVMDAGGLLAQGTPDELVRNDRVLDAYLGTAYVGADA